MADELDLRVKRSIQPTTETDWTFWTSEAKAITAMIKASRFQDKSIAIETGIDPTTLSRVQSGQARLSEQNLCDLMDACGSEAWLHYWLLKRGYDPRSLRRFESDLERQVRELREEIETMRHERATEIRLIKDLKSA